MSTNNTTETSENKEECKPLFRAKTDPINFEFSQFIPTIVAIGVFIYGILMFQWDKISAKTTTIDMNGLYVIFTIGFFILFLNNIFNGDEERKKYYSDLLGKAKGIPFIYYLLKRFFNYKIKTFGEEIAIPIINRGNVRYYEYPFNFTIFIGIILIVLIIRILYLQKEQEDHGQTENDKANALMEDDAGLLYNTTHFIGIVGIIFAIFTNKFILNKTNDEIPGQEKYMWIARLVFYLFGFISVFIILGSIARLHSEPIAPIDIDTNINIKEPSNSVIGWWLGILSTIVVIITLYTILNRKK